MPLRKTLAVALVVCGVSAATGKGAAADTTRVFGVWTATCWTKDNRCAAETDAIIRSPYRLTLSVSRANAADAAWNMGLRLRKVRLGRDAAISLNVDGEARTLEASGYEVLHGGGTVLVSNGEEAAAVIHTLMAGDRAEVAFASEGRGKISRDFLLNGLTASLTWINGQQGRATSVTAQLAPEPDAETARPPAPPARETAAAPHKMVAENEAAKDKTAKPDVMPAPAAPEPAAPAGVPEDMIARHQQKSECDIFGEGALTGLKARRAPLSNGKALYLVPCYAADGTVASRLYVARGDDVAMARTLYFANFSHTLGWYGSDTLVNAAYDAETRVLTAGGTGGGKGCGNAARYRWDGFDFRLMEYRASEDCDGPADPAAWPLVYEAGGGGQ